MNGRWTSTWPIVWGLATCGHWVAVAGASEGPPVELKPGPYLVRYKHQGAVARSLGVDLKSGRIRDGRATAADGEAMIVDERNQVIAEGPLTIVEGWIAVPGKRGSRFRCIPSMDLEGDLPANWTGPEVPLARVRLDKEGCWTLEDDAFFFLIEASHGELQAAFALSFARATLIRAEPGQGLTLWGRRVRVAEDGEVRIRCGRPLNGTPLTVGSPVAAAPVPASRPRPAAPSTPPPSEPDRARQLEAQLANERLGFALVLLLVVSLAVVIVVGMAIVWRRSTDRES